MRFRVLGPLQAESDGRRLRLGGPRQRAVLAALLSSPNRTLSRSRLIELVWDEPTPSAEANLRSYVWKLRTLLSETGDDAPRVVSDQGFRLRVEPGELDLWDFDRYADQARRAREAGRRAEAAAAFARALAFVDGEPFQDVEGGSRFEGFRAAFRERHDHVVEQYVDLRMELGEHAELVGELRAWHARQPLWERLAARLMLALYRSGRRGEALAVYRDTRAALIETLGTEPDRELRQMHQRILLGESGPAASQRPAVAAPPTAAVDQLPFDLGAFAGRAPELALLDRLTPPDAAASIAVVSGPAGVGKTSTAVHWAHRSKDAFPDGRLYIDLRGCTPGEPALDPGEVLRAFLDVLGAPPETVPDGTEQRAARFRALLADKRMLVVLDNAKDPAQVRPLLPGAARCRTVVTSRSSLTGLVASTGAVVVQVETMADAEARSMLAARLGTDRLAREPEAVERLLDSCARLPLALAVVTARAAARPGDPLALLADELDAAATPLDGLGGSDPATDPRTLLRWSYAQLSPEAARLFRRLGLHPGPDCSAPAAASLAGTGLERTRAALAELVEANLLRRRTGHRHAFHDLLRAFASELARTEDEGADRDAATRRMLDFYLHTAFGANRLVDPNRDPIELPPALSGLAPLRFADDEAAMAWLASEGPVLVAAVKLAAERGFDAACWRLAWAVRDYLDRGRWHDQAAVWRLALDAARRLGDVDAQVRIGRLLASSYSHLGRFEDARELLDEALVLCRGMRDRIGEAHVHHLHGRLWKRQGRLAEAIACNRRAIALYRAAGHVAGEANALNSIGWYHSLAGDYEPALRHCEQAMELMVATGDRHGQAATLDSLGYVHHRLGQEAQAIAYYQRALDLYAGLSNRHEEAVTFANLGDAQDALGDVEAAGRAWRQAIAIFDELGRPEAETLRTRLDG